MSTIEELRESLKALETTMENEREAHVAQKEEQGQRIKQLEGRLQEQDQQKFKKIQESRKTSTSMTTGGTTKTTTTTSSTMLKSTPQKAASNDGSQTPGSQTAGSSSSKVKFSNKKSPAPHTPSGKQEKLTNGSTALQHSWDKFCVRAKEDFSPKELSLMSLETIKSLLSHYSYNNPIEIAQVEAQWALIQDGEKAVNSPTPFSSPSNRARSFSPMPVKADFCLRTNVLAPHLSQRRSLSTDAPSGGDPNGSGERHRSPGYTGPSRGARKWNEPRGGNPNEGPAYSSKAQSTRQLTVNGEYPYSHKVYPRGKSRSGSPNTKEFTTYPEEKPARMSAGKRLFDQQSPGSAKVMGLKMVPSPDRSEDKKRSLRFIPQRNQVLIG